VHFHYHKRHVGFDVGVQFCYHFIRCDALPDVESRRQHIAGLDEAQSIGLLKPSAADYHKRRGDLEPETSTDGGKAFRVVVYLRISFNQNAYLKDSRGLKGGKHEVE